MLKNAKKKEKKIPFNVAHVHEAERGSTAPMSGSGKHKFASGPLSPAELWSGFQLRTEGSGPEWGHLL